MTDQTTPTEPADATFLAHPAEQPLTAEEIARVATAMTWRGTEGKLVPKLFDAARASITLRAENEQLNLQLMDYQTRPEYENGYMNGTDAAAHVAIQARAELATAKAKLQEVAEHAASSWLNLDGFSIDQTELPVGFGNIVLSRDEVMEIVTGGIRPVITKVFFDAYNELLAKVRELEVRLAAHEPAPILHGDQL